ncbi:hypothetical protein BJ138DRAFT_1104460 [Hygrophoropsis aurantiaca]|uniref:Uncharacterized protein n=1 Tax=Hygrophoropsis aurantiaca TaxID=72124 RepID=A0ACB8A1E0_9AGAM|nr:hypothetical protein BJ138DRAFT_1104460 [Hygrophoropsis aurantiaca]
MAKDTSAKTSPYNRHTPITPRRPTSRSGDPSLNHINDYTSVHGDSPSPLPRIAENNITPTPLTPHPIATALSTPPPAPAFMEDVSPSSDSSGLSLESFPTDPSPISEQGFVHPFHEPTPPLASITDANVDQSTPLQNAEPAISPAPPVVNPDAINILAHIAVAQTNLEITQQDIATEALAGPPYFTPTPEEGFPPIHMAHSAQMFDFLDPAVINAWIAVPEPKFLVRVFDYDGGDPINTTPVLTERIRVAISKIASMNNLNADAIRVSPPSKTNNNANPGNPLSFLVHNVPEYVKGITISKRVWSSQSITFEARDFLALSMPNLLFALQGFSSICTPGDVHKIVFDTWTTIDTRAELTDFFSEAGVPQGQLHDTIVEFIQSIKIKRLEWRIPGGTSLPRFNIFAHSPISNPSVWTKIRLFFRNLSYSAPLEGSAFYAAFIPCQICNSLDHPRGLCPFPTVLYWNGPVIQTRPRTNTMRGRGRGRGNGRIIHN